MGSEGTWLLLTQREAPDDEEGCPCQLAPPPPPALHARGGDSPALPTPCPLGSCVSCLTCHRKPGTGSSPAELSRGWRMASDHQWQRWQCLGVMWIDRPPWGSQRRLWVGQSWGRGGASGLKLETLRPPMTSPSRGWGGAPRFFTHTFIKY